VDPFNRNTSICKNLIHVVHILDIGGNSHGSFEFDRTTRVLDVKKKLSLLEDCRADLLLEGNILPDCSILLDALKLEDCGMPADITLTAVIGRKTALDRIMDLSWTGSPAMPLDVDDENDDVLLYCVALPPLVNDVFYTFGFWGLVLPRHLSHWALIIEASLSLFGITHLMRKSKCNQITQPKGVYCCGTCLPCTLILFSTWNLLWSVWLWGESDADVPAYNIKSRASNIIMHALSIVTMLAFGLYWSKLIELWKTSAGLRCYWIVVVGLFWVFLLRKLPYL
jgi:hypothetical protein